MYVDLSILVAAHREGRLAHHTMSSLFRACEALSAEGVSYEIIITIDNGDQATHKYFKRYHRDKRIKIFSTDFGELAQSRNFALIKSSGKMISTLDADDLISGNWLIKAYKTIARSSSPLVLHTEYSVNFGTENVIWHKENSRSKQDDAVIMTWANRWDSAIVTQRKVLEDFPYQPNTEGYGSEDWHFNSQTLSANIPHHVVPNTVLFVRRKNVSLMTSQATNYSTVRYTDLLDFNYLKAINTDHLAISPSDDRKPNSKNLAHSAVRITKQIAKKIHHTGKQYPAYSAITKRPVAAIKKYHNNTKTDYPSRFPEWLLSEWREIHKFDRSIFPGKHLVESVPIYKSEIYNIGIAMVELAKKTTKQPDYLFIISRLFQGGAELVMLRYVETLKKLHPDWHIVILATETGDNPWENKVPTGVDFINFGNIMSSFDDLIKLKILARYIIQSKTSRLHIAQSDLGYKFISKYADITKNIPTYTFSFCDDIDEEGRVSGHIHSGLPLAYDNINKIFTDNMAVIKQLSDEYGYDSKDKKFIVHYQPVNMTINKPLRRKDNNRLNVLWASRITKQKRPDVLIDIASNLDNQSIQIDAYGSFDHRYTKDDFDGINSLIYKGEFNGIDTIPVKNYDVFLYTSENDGIPNIILEMIAKGLSVVAPRIGGIDEIIHEETGILIEDHESADEYIEALNILLRNEDLRLALIKGAQKKLSDQHSSSRFQSMIRKDIV